VDNRRVVISCAKLTFPANFFRLIFFCVQVVFPFIEFLAHSHPTIAQNCVCLATLAALTKCTYYLDAMPVWAPMENWGAWGACRNAARFCTCALNSCLQQCWRRCRTKV